MNRYDMMLSTREGEELVLVGVEDFSTIPGFLGLESTTSADYIYLGVQGDMVEEVDEIVT
jgi:hypothetical protein